MFLALMTPKVEKSRSMGCFLLFERHNLESSNNIYANIFNNLSMYQKQSNYITSSSIANLDV